MAAARSGAQRPADTRCCRRAAPDSVTAGPDSWRYSTAAPIWAAVHTGHSRRSGNPGTPAPGNRGRRRFGRADGAKLARNFLAQVEAGRQLGRGRAGDQDRAGGCAPGEERSGDSERWHVSSHHPCEGPSPPSTVDACRLRLRRDRNSGQLARPARAASGRPACWSSSLAIPFTIPCARRTCLPASTGDERPGRGAARQPCRASRPLTPVIRAERYASRSTASLSCFAMRALTTCLGGISMACPVAGLRPRLAVLTGSLVA